MQLACGCLVKTYIDLVAVPGLCSFAGLYSAYLESPLLSRFKFTWLFLQKPCCRSFDCQEISDPGLIIFYKDSL